MEFRVLGPFDVRQDGVAIDLGARKQRILLALLAVRANTPVALSRILNELWGDRQPKSAVRNAQQYAATLRRLMRRIDSRTDRLVRADSGYQLRTSPDELDLAAYQADAKRGQRALADGDLTTARGWLKQAIGRWRGPMVIGLPRGSELDEWCAAVEAEQVALARTLAGIHLQLGEPGEAILLLSPLLIADPYREDTYELLMRAHYLHDGIGAAVAVYDVAQRKLSGDLGVEPGPELRRLRRAVLDRDPGLATSQRRYSAILPVPRPRTPSDATEGAGHR